MTFVPAKRALVLVLALCSTLALAACGGGAEEADDAGVTVSEAGTGAATAPDAVPAAGDAPATQDEVPGDEDAAAETPAASPTATPSAAAAAPAAAPATPTAVAAAKPPEFAVCAACHSTEPGKNGLGPTLAGVYGAKAGHISGFDYSEAMNESGLTWNEGNLDRYLADPRGVVPGTKMAYPGLKDAAKRKAMVDYLKTL
jgi:cytochrome c2